MTKLPPSPWLTLAGRRLTAADRLRAHGKFLFAGGRKSYLKGVTYGPFRPSSPGSEYGSEASARRDFQAMAAAGFNSMRVYTAPPRWLLDLAAEHGLRVLVGLPWEQHVSFLDDRRRARDIARRVCREARALAGHPALLGYAVGNEIPAPIARWHGKRALESFIARLYGEAKGADPDALVTYVNYPTTEYLELPFLDFVAFNVYLEEPDRLRAYLARLQNLAGDRPLLLTEVGLDSRRHGEKRQARTLDWQLRTVYAAGTAGAFVFAWTDEWHRGGVDVEDWDFGLTRRDRSAKPALGAAAAACAEAPFPSTLAWPRISVVVCSLNGARTLRDTLEALSRLDYPNHEVIVVDDGSTDATPLIAHDYAVKLISTPNRGLSSARNTGLRAATGEIVAYTDDDAYPDPHWLTYLAVAFMSTDYDAIGGPNLPPPGEGVVADAVAASPGGPMHVLLSDTEAEHLPGCNMAFRRARLDAVGGFDARFRVAGDDVDVCWRLQERGSKLGFSPAAVVWHHRRNSVAAYWRQQKGYGKAEALLAAKWPEKYNRLGHVAWAGRLYGAGVVAQLFRRGRIYHGTWGSAPFQSLYQPMPTSLAALTLMPEWYLVIVGLVALALLGLSWPPLLVAAPLAAAAVAAPILRAIASARHASYPTRISSRAVRLRRGLLTAALHLVQPAARLAGRIEHGLTPWRRRGQGGLIWPRQRTASSWSETWQPATDRLEAIERALGDSGAATRRGADFDAWDLETEDGLSGRARLLVAVEEHGTGKQLARIRIWPCWPKRGIALAALSAVLSLVAARAGAPVAAVGLAALAVASGLRILVDAAQSLAALRNALARAGLGVAE